ncbi:MAG: hypothetical protein APF81_26070 [Desulfosporosinus sp. BRH_c37]|nr:MAG: hypothetical protein APF81_26070 [Desulfosporosinus sp. BRH_c37]
MSVPDLVFREYMPSPKSMAGQMFEVNNVIKQKYWDTINPEPTAYVYNLLKVEADCQDLKTLLSLNTKVSLVNIVETIKTDVKSDIQTNLRKDLLIPELARGILKSFEVFLELMNDSMYQLVLKFRNRQRVPLQDLHKQWKSVDYLIERGYMFRCLGQGSKDEEVLLLPEELQHLVDRLDELKIRRDVTRNTAICKIGKNILYLYGVMKESDFDRCLDALYFNFEQNRLNKKIDLGDLSDAWNYQKQATFQNVNVVFKHYAQYSSKVKRVCFEGGSYSGYHNSYYCYYSVFDPYNIFYEQERREDLDFRSLCWSELITDRPADQKAQTMMVEYLTKQLRINPIQAQKLSEEWSLYIKNGENPTLWLNNILEHLKFSSSVQLNQLLSFSSAHFANDLNIWPLKGHTPKELMDTQLEKPHSAPQNVQASVGEVSSVDKVGRNEPCPCGSGRKYKKCCGR